MKAITQRTYGSPAVLALTDIDRPSVKDDEVLIRVRAAAVSMADWYLTQGEPYVARLAFGLRRPRHAVRGRDVAGQVEAVGANVADLRPGDAVYAEVDTGSFAEFVAVPAALVAPMPVNLTFEQAAAVPWAGGAALQGLRDAGNVQPGQTVLVNGASGGVGTFAVQIARALGAEVTGVCSTRSVDLVRSLGAAHVVDYTREDFTRSGQRYDVIFDLVANRSLADFRRALTPTGTLVVASGNGGRWFGPLGRMARALLFSPFVGQRLRPFAAKQSKADLGVLRQLIESGQVTPAIDRTFPLSEAPEALRYFVEEHARGKVVIAVGAS
ncbi:MAG TPA: NAD(P)-dependent alcohol dehydrogenase [Candidatus Limnocylindrales bacterium]|nr:NAD(P)-dependent alcohol dehydrogenase [Candidatus Limnocylindrales bacterium]